MSICWRDPAQGLSLGYCISGGYHKTTLSLHWKQNPIVVSNVSPALTITTDAMLQCLETSVTLLMVKHNMIYWSHEFYNHQQSSDGGMSKEIRNCNYFKLVFNLLLSCCKKTITICLYSHQVSHEAKTTQYKLSVTDSEKINMEKCKNAAVVLWVKC